MSSTHGRWLALGSYVNKTLSRNLSRKNSSKEWCDQTINRIVKRAPDSNVNQFVLFREFLLIFRKAAAGELKEDSGLSLLAKQCEVDVKEVGVGGAKTFFEAKVT